MIEGGWGPRALAARLGRVFADALAPAPLQATAVLKSTSGTTTTLPKSKVGNVSVIALNLDWTPGGNPGIPSTWYGTIPRLASADVSASTSDGTKSVRFCAYLSGTNNNGTPTKLVTDLSSQQNPECTTPPNGDQNALSVVTQAVSATQSVADFGHIYVTKNGTITFTLTVVSGGATTKSINSQANIKPAQKTK